MSIGFNSSNPVGGVLGIFRDLPVRKAAVVEPPNSSEMLQGQGIRRSEQALERLERDEELTTPSRGRSNDIRAAGGIAVYQTIANQPQRAEIQMMLGIDLYA